MPYNSFTIESAKKAFGLKVQDASLFADAPSVAPTPVLQQFLQRYQTIGSTIGTEKARSEFIIAPILGELLELCQHRISLFSGVEFNVDESQGLNGRCDFMISASNTQYSIEAPVLTVVEAKKDDINRGLGQCMAEMVAAQMFNAQEGQAQEIVYGCVTTGSVWRFLQLKEKQVLIERQEYFIDQLEQLLGILLKLVDTH